MDLYQVSMCLRNKFEANKLESLHFYVVVVIALIHDSFFLWKVLCRFTIWKNVAFDLTKGNTFKKFGLWVFKKLELFESTSIDECTM